MAQNIETPQSASAGANENNAGLSSLQILPPRQQEVFDLLLAFTKKNGYPPTNRELANLIGVRSANAIAEHIRALERKGVVSVARGVARGITVVGQKEPAMAIQLLSALLNDEPGARDRAVEFLRMNEVQP
ncbi:DNA-binding protein [Klebsiella pneumoniae subsp. pneumoniae]|uniref:LexA family protein n=1 Tax=Klebsiella pneumoniae TaxID=573 RepID=UPI000DA24DFF|nr:DNA-binding protein [Klebsiella pneumoniae]MCD5660890.1 DNA-binding protein [Klebsiella pneumoniae]PZA44821.1 DNA-binding protein [Klebsiella pneumoniae subsp. pneumoniae]PZA58307.1 DNA-binding protein [Klebsiella pneumoniae subsp. pneumoniae]PZA61858.1 DNA-binding protein [Klebsiella pneumoniae subsp. pneumoniae]PZA70341.1 DNA-binding protein [Klebsiella pneumoniae subsp. pneumoniae]